MPGSIIVQNKAVFINTLPTGLTLDKTYPAGLPSAEEIRVQRENLLSSGQAERQLHALTLSQEDREIAVRGKALFSDEQKRRRICRRCTITSLPARARRVCISA